LRRNDSGCWIFSALFALAAALGCASAAPPDEQRPPPERLTGAEYVPGYTLAQPPPAALPGIQMRLPLSLGAAPPSRGTTVRWVRLSFRLAPVRGANYGIYMPYSAPHAAVYLNGAYIGASQEFHVPDSDTWNYPFYLPVPGVLLHNEGNRLLVELVPHGKGITELGHVWVGRDEALRPLYERRLWLQVIGIEVVTLLVGLIGAFVGVLWLRRRNDTLFGLFALSCALWAVRNMQFFVVHTYHLFYFELTSDAALFWLVAVLYMLSFRILERRFPKLEMGLFAYALIATVAMWAAGPLHRATVAAMGFAGLLPIGIVYQVYLTWATLRSPTVLRQLLWLAAVATSLSGAYDLALMVKWVAWPASNLMPYSALFYAVTVGWALIDRFVRTHNEYEQLNAVLEARVRQREQALLAQYARAAELERERTIATERDRILRDMHDGVGLHLISARRLIEKGGHSREQIAAVLGDAMDELRIAIDSMKPNVHDLLVMLGNLRYRLEPRLNAAGIQLHWDIADAGEISRLGPTEVTEITRIVQEVCTNAIKHSHATDMSLAVRCSAPDTLSITITDNGCGYDVATLAAGEGVKNMRKRARTLGARLEITSRPGETRIVLTLRAPRSRETTLAR
jgi:signal transduction histidine kinase